MLEHLESTFYDMKEISNEITNDDLSPTTTTVAK